MHHNIVGIMPIYGRRAITREAIKLLKEQEYVTTVVVVGSSDIDKETVEDLDITYVEAPNRPLSFKYQAAFDKAKELSPRAILLCGSDDFLTKDWSKVCLEFIDACRLVPSPCCAANVPINLLALEEIKPMTSSTEILSIQ